jgi:hypothetical protein
VRDYIWGRIFALLLKKMRWFERGRGYTPGRNEKNFADSFCIGIDSVDPLNEVSAVAFQEDSIL